MSAERFEETAAGIREIHHEEIEQIVEDLREILADMGEHEEAGEDEYRSSLEELAATAAESALVDQVRALKAQNRALERQNELESSPRPDETKSEAVSDDQAKAKQAQGDVQGKLDMAVPAPPDAVRAAQARAAADQLEAIRAQARARSSERELARIEREAVTARNGVKSKNVALGHAKRHRQNLTKWLATAKKMHGLTLENLQDYEGHLAERRKALAAAEKSGTGIEHHRRLVESTIRSVKQRANSVEKAASRVGQLERDLRAKELALEAAEAAAEEAADTASGLMPADMERRKTDVKAAKAEATRMQQVAVKSQSGARDLLAKHLAETSALAAEGPVTLQTEAIEQEAGAIEVDTQAAESARQADRRSTDPTLHREYADDFVGAYDKASDLEKAIAEAYGRIKAYELAAHLKTSPERARDEIDLPMPSRPGIDIALLQSSPKTAGRFRQHSAEVRRAVHQVRSMASASRSLRDQVLQRESSLARALAAAAHEVSGGEDRDLTGLMRRARSRRAERAAAKRSGATGGRGEKARRPKAAEQQHSRAPTPESMRRIQGARPGRVFGAGGEQAEWVYIDTWYTLGPFPNPKRVNLHRKFPPESGVDLDARYPGGKHGSLTWQFVQGDLSKRFSKGAPLWTRTPIAMVPAGGEPYGVWYAYTEVVFDQDRDVWIAFGNDDRSDIWINGLPVWHSSDQLKGWRPDQARRRVRFHKGTNEILYRIENGWYEAVFSFCIHLGTLKPPTSAVTRKATGGTE